MLQRNNKYNKHVTRRLATMMAASIILSGCGLSETHIESNYEIVDTINENDNIDNDTQQIIIIPDEEEHFEVVELNDIDEEREISELCITHDLRKQEKQSYWSMVYKNSDSEYKIMFCEIFSVDMKQFDVVDAFSGTPLFSYYTENGKPHILKSFTDIFNNIPYFEDTEILQIHALSMFINLYIDMNVSFDKEIISKYFVEDSNGVTLELYTIDELAKIYVNLIPEQFRVNGKDLGLVFDETEKVYKLG